MSSLFSVDTIFFVVLGYSMSYIEFFGTVLIGLSVYLTARNKISSWPIGIVGVVLYGFLFYQIQLYSDLLEQVYYLATGFWGWWLWAHGNKGDTLPISSNSRKVNIASALTVLIGGSGLGYAMTNAHSLGIAPASFPYLDAITTIASFTANYLLVKRRLESWYLWIGVDIIAVWLYWVKGVPFLSLLYFAFLVNAVWGYSRWRKEYEAL